MSKPTIFVLEWHSVGQTEWVPDIEFVFEDPTEASERVTIMQRQYPAGEYRYVEYVRVAD